MRMTAAPRAFRQLRQLRQLRPLRRPRWKPMLAVAAVAAASVLAATLLPALAAADPAAAAAAEAPPFGTALHPFSAQSPWNARPVQPRFDDFEIPRSRHFPNLAEGTWSTGVFIAAAGDPPATVSGLPGRPLWDPDAQQVLPSLVIPRWPAGVQPASGADGHAEIVDPVAGIVHSFYKLRQQEGQWQSAQYAWSRLDGRGFGDPAHFYQGARAAGVPALAGLIRRHEIDDGLPHYRHALALSLTFNALSPQPAYIYPATHADRGAEKTNSGRIPEGALLMLPPDFEVERIAHPRLRKVARTLQRHGAYVVDRNDGAPFSIYVENGSGMGLHSPVWNPTVARDLDRIRAGLRQVLSAAAWLDGHGRALPAEPALNLLSLRGPWSAADRAGIAARYDSWQQALVFEAAARPLQLHNERGSGLGSVHWGQPQPGERYRLTARVQGHGALRLRLVEAGGARAPLYDSGELGDGQSVVFAWPQPAVRLALAVRGGGQGVESRVGASLVAERAASVGRKGAE